MSIEIKLLTEPEEFFQANVIDSICFNFKLDINDESIRKPEPFADMYGAFVDGKLVAKINAHKYKMMLHGKYVKMCGIGGVSSLIGYRNMGLIRRLMSAIFDDTFRDGYVYSYLYPFSYRYYGKFGYGKGINNIRAEIPLESLEGYKCNYDIRMYNKGDSIEPYKEIFEKYAASYTGLVENNDWRWLDEFNAPENHKSIYLFTENDKPKAYFGYENFHNREGGHLKTHGSIAWDSPEAFHNILGFLYTLRMHNSKIEVVLPEPLSVENMISEPAGITLTRYMSGQSRIINVLEALKAYPWHSDSGTFTLGVHDDYYTEQSGVYRINFGGGEVEAEKNTIELSKAPDIELDIRALSSLLLGTYGYKDLEFDSSGLVKINNNIPLFEKVFTRRPTFFTERF